MTQRPYAAKIKKMYLASILWAAAIVLAIFGAVVAIASILLTAWLPAAVFAALLLAAVAALLFLLLYFRRHAVYRMHQLACKHGSLERLAARFSAKQYADAFYEGKVQRDGISYAVRIIQTDELREDRLKEMQSRIRGVFPCRKEAVGLLSIGKYAIVNLIVCNRATAQALNKIAQNTRKNINRTECLFYTVVSSEDGSLYYPDIYDGLEYLQVKSYAVFCDMVTEAVL